MKRRFLSVLVPAILIIGAAFSVRGSAAPSNPRIFLPLVNASPSADLTVASVRLTMQGYQAGCLPYYLPLVVEACVRNQGRIDAGPFGVWVHGSEVLVLDGAKVGSTVCVQTLYGGTNYLDVVVDTADQVPESDESNNTWIGQVPVPTPPVLCTATPWPMPTETPTVTPTIAVRP